MTSPRTCPYCRRVLREVLHREVHVDVCDCGGMWFDRGELETWARVGKVTCPLPDGSNDSPYDANTFRCPRCELDSLQSRVLDGVHFARCDHCAGIWLTPEGAARLDPASGPERAHRDRAVGQVIDGLLSLLASAW